MPHAPESAGPVAAAVPSSNQLKILIPEHNGTNGTHKSNGITSPNSNGLLSPDSNGPLSPASSNGLLSPPLISDAIPKRPPKPPPSRLILPIKKAKTLPIHFEEETVPPKTPTTLLNGKKLYVTKTLKEIHSIPANPPDNGKLLVNRSPSPSYRRSLSSASVETGSIAELAKRHYPSNLLTSRSPSPLSMRSNGSVYSTCSSNGTYVPLSRSTSVNSSVYSRHTTPTPRRMYPQTCDRRTSVDLTELRAKEQAPVVFDANLQFVLGCNRQPVRQKFKPVAAHLEEGTSSNYLSAKIDSFLKKTDHVMDEWRRLGHKDDSETSRRIGRSKSATNIMIKGFTLFSRSTSRASSMCRGISEDRTTVSELDELSEVGGDLAEERAAAALATERADAEAAERLRIERDNRDLLANNQRLQQASERLELELLHWRSADNGGAEPSDSEGSEADAAANGDKYKRRYEQAHRELQLLRAQLRRQHEDDLEQLVTVKKQLEKKVQDAYEEVEEQRAVAAQWKRKLQKLTNDMADLRSLLDEQTCRNNLLEKRQRKFDAELHGAQEELKRERAAKERLSRERDLAHADKYALEQSLSEARLELELKEERLTAAQRELEERGGGGDEVAALRRTRAELERRVRDQEEELDDLAGQIQLLESSKLRLEMLLEQQRKEARLEAAARDDEMEETRANASKKLKILESQLESEHSERSLLLRERHELERRLAALEESARAETVEQTQLVQRLKRDLKRYRALLRDAQTMLEQKEKEGGAKTQIRQLKNQVEDLELAVRAATKAKQAAEAEASEATAALEEANRARNEAAERALTATRDAATARAALDDAEEEAAELLKKYRGSTSALCAAQAEAREAAAKAEAATEEARQARDKLAELAQRLASAEAGHSHTQHEAERRLQLRNKELESSLELEATSRARLEGQLARLRDAHEQLANELAQARAREQQAADDQRKLARQLRELKEENSALNAKLSEAGRAKCVAEAAAAAAASEAAAARDEARLAARRAHALQEAIAGDLSSPGDDVPSDSDNDSYSSDESIGTFLANHKLSPSAPSRNSMQLDSHKSGTPEGRASRSSAGSGSKPISPTKESFA
ncbi:unconventional myosin-XVIIIa-like isoform X2 [Leguminivora glycinivorella]|uniref:unconventional myosin-XVIIIa-like isoform X1 n=1 Tax=Leguminivora glycinivorella TaxID=1035111 RepID=UPI00200DCE83|nr:unconventional myosin-XVIIIa-like isoform X1 [Leguminivora glycinivorella]XP_048006818.1 unconventional myosin-XVIIIa-like isoform X2 [Leguminivora glycinivorella]